MLSVKFRWYIYSLNDLIDRFKENFFGACPYLISSEKHQGMNVRFCSTVSGCNAYSTQK